MEKWRNLSYRLLRSSERYFKTDMVYLVKGGFWLSISQVLTSLSSLVLAIAFANLLPKEIYGTYKYILSLVSVLAIFTLPGIETAVTQAIARNLDGSFMTGFWTKVRWGLIGSVISLIAGGYYYVNGNFDLGLALFIAAVFLPLTNAFDLYNSILQGKKQFKFYTWCNSLTQIITTAALVSFIIFNQQVVKIVLVFFLANTIVNWLIFLLTKKTFLTNEAVDPVTVTYGKHLSVISFIGLIADQLDQILIFHFLGAADLAIYVLAVAPTDQLKGVIKNIPFLAFPKLANRPRAELRPAVLQKALILGASMAIMVLGYIIVAPWFFQIFFPKYLASVHYSQVLALSLIFITPAIFLATFFESQVMTKEIYHYNISYNLISTILLLPFIYWLGLWGAIIARLLTRAITLGYTLIIFDRQQ